MARRSVLKGVATVQEQLYTRWIVFPDPGVRYKLLRLPATQRVKESHDEFPNLHSNLLFFLPSLKRKEVQNPAKRPGGACDKRQHVHHPRE